MTPEAVEYRSRGRVLFIGAAAMWAPWLQRNDWPEPLQPAFLLLDDIPVAAAARTMRAAGQTISIQGHLGTYRVRLDDGRDVAAELLGPGEVFDLIVDAGDPPQLAREVAPFGYFAPLNEGRDLADVVAQLPEWVGEFEKRRYFAYRDGLCARRGGGREGCRRCVDACPAEAIALRPTAVEVDPYLCQGCGDCTTVCPTGALSYCWPPPTESLSRWLAALEARPAAPVAIVRARQPAEPGDDWQVFPVHSVAACGPEVWLTLLAAGAAGVWLQRAGLTAPSVAALEAQFGWVTALLRGLGYRRRGIGWLEQLPEDGPAALVSEPVSPAVVESKTDQLHLALARLTDVAPQRLASVPLPSPAPLGAVAVNADRCTLCYACVSVCPTGALQAGGESPRLGFVEAACVQCAQCQSQCPEAAITLEPCWLTDAGQRRRLRWLQEDEVLLCLDCGKPFGSRRLVEQVAARIATHPLFADPRQRRRLYLCEDCRIRDLAHD
ncbi:4Fe-4S binding protein [Methylomarinovum caldicuralii]|nr:4Fe-4S binding protein [Methylomarinovum caldicuralii]